MLDGLIEWLSDLAKQFFGFLDGMVPPVPPVVDGACGVVAGAVEWVSPMLQWVPVEALVVAFGIMFSGAVAGLVIIVARAVASYATLGGGAV